MQPVYGVRDMQLLSPERAVGVIGGHGVQKVSQVLVAIMAGVPQLASDRVISYSGRVEA
jgi:hypothetical protein